MRRLFAILIVFAIASSAGAYIDPGTGGMIVGGLGSTLWVMAGAAVAGVVAIIARFWGAIRTMVLSLWRKGR